jgi:hypothetical protein
MICIAKGTDIKAGRLTKSRNGGRKRERRNIRRKRIIN